jgi:hypothetical protein
MLKGVKAVKVVQIMVKTVIINQVLFVGDLQTLLNP